MVATRDPRTLSDPTIFELRSCATKIKKVCYQNVSHDSIYMHVIHIARELGNMHTHGK